LSPSVPFAEKARAHGGEAEYLPLKAMIEEFGGTVVWDSRTQSAQVKRDSTVVTVKPGLAEVLVNGKPVQLKAPVVNKNGKSRKRPGCGIGYTGRNEHSNGQRMSSC